MICVLLTPNRTNHSITFRFRNLYYVNFCFSANVEESVFRWWSHFTRVLLLMGFFQTWRSCRYLCPPFILRNVRMMEQSVNKLSLKTRAVTGYFFWTWFFLFMIPFFLTFKVMSCCVEPSLCSCGTRARAPPWRADLGYVCCTWREDLPHCCPHGGPGTKRHS